ncbi:MAG: zinc ribbon domain-containing protein [Candidatus Zixiibacteriota bacterium]
MPIYEFQCGECCTVFEKLCRIGGEAEVRCPECGSTDCRKLISLVASQAGSCGCETCEPKPT